MRQIPFQPTVASLLDYACPQWFRDAKFGIYLHWGVYSLPEQGEWYPRQMYLEGHPNYLYHLEHYGHPSQFGYKDLIPRWQAESWEPERLVSLFKQAGARYFTPCAVHHDNFDLWNSRHQRWNSVNMGPRKDITGIWRAEALRQGLRFGVTTHLERTWSWFAPNKGADRSGPLAGVPYDGNDLAHRDLYLEPHADTDRRHPRNAPAQWRRHWLDRITDLIDNYHPDCLYIDGALPFLGDDNGQTGLELIAHLYNHSMEQHGGQLEAVMCTKGYGYHSAHGIYVEGIATLDVERQRLDVIHPQPWQTDTSVGLWGYHAGVPYRTAGEIIHELVDIVSKNGNMLLNVPPRADGTLDAETEGILAEIGRWLVVNGEAIYATRPWLTCGKDNLRFTRRSDAVYAILLAWPERGNVLEIRELGQKQAIGPVASVRLLGYDGELRWGQDAGEHGALRVVLPDSRPGEHAWVLRVGF
jgi:alpha-L-fucosidase